MSVLERAGDPPDTRAALARRLAAAAVGLVGLPLLVEAVALDPIAVIRYREPLFAALRVVLGNSLPYLAAALSLAVVALIVRVPAPGPARPAPRASMTLAALALAAGSFAALGARSLDATLLAGDAAPRSRDGAVQLGGGGPLATAVPIEAVPIEEAGAIAERFVPAQAAPYTATVRWIGLRTLAEPPAGTHVELVGGGARLDVTRDFRDLAPGQPALLTKRLRLGASPARVRLRLSEDPLPPVVFFDADRGLAARGLKVEGGHGDHAYQAPARVGPGAPGPAPLAVEGEHVDGGYTVVVLSGEDWRRYDLGELRAHGAELELVLEGADVPPWAVRVVGDGVETGSVALSSLRREVGARETHYFLGLRQLDWGKVAPGDVVGVALAYAGRPGPIGLAIVGARVTLAGHQVSGYAVAATAAFDPDSGPVDGLFAAGVPPAGWDLARHAYALRLLAAVLAALAFLGPGALAAVLAGRRLATLAALLAGPLAVTILPELLRPFAEPRLEQVPIALAVATLAIAGLARRPVGMLEVAPEVTGAHAAATEVLWLRGFTGIAVLCAIAVHVTADAAGGPYTAASPGARLPALVARAVASGLDYPALLLGALFVLGQTLASTTRPRRTVVRERLRALVVPFALFSLAFLAFRHVKAVAFGYEDAYRRELASGFAWLRYALLGDAQYHLFYLPLLFLLTLLAPLFRRAGARPALALLLPATLALWPYLAGLAYDTVGSPELRAYALRATDGVAFAGYGFFAFALVGHRPRARRAALAAAALVLAAGLALLVLHGLDEARAGRWLPLALPAHLARYLMPATLLVVCALGAGIRWPATLVRIGDVALGVYLIHPAVLDLLEILERRSAAPPAPMAALNFVVVATVSILAARALARVPALRPAIGLPRGESP